MSYLENSNKNNSSTHNQNFKKMQKSKFLNNSMIFHTNIMESLKAVFFNESLRRWHFEVLLKELGISRERLNYFLKKLVKERMIRRIKPKGKMPYYIANRESARFRLEKRLFGIKSLTNSGLLDHISSDDKIKTAIIFGSFARGDWSKSSDIDLFLYGDMKYFEKGKFESILKRDIQLFGYNRSNKLREELDPKLIPNIIKGFNIKGSLEPFEVILDG